MKKSTPIWMFVILLVGIAFALIQVYKPSSAYASENPAYKDGKGGRAEVYDNSQEENLGVKDKDYSKDGSSLSERLDRAYKNLHKENSAVEIRKDFPDIELIYTDYGKGKNFPSEIIPFEYYYSQEADKTFSLCAIERSVFICDGRIDNLITDEQMNSESCKVTPVYEDY